MLLLPLKDAKTVISLQLFARASLRSTAACPWAGGHLN